MKKLICVCPPSKENWACVCKPNFETIMFISIEEGFGLAIPAGALPAGEYRLVSR